MFQIVRDSMVSSDAAVSGHTIASVEDGTTGAASQQPQEASVSRREQRPAETVERAARRLLTHKASAALCFALVALVFVTGMALLATGLHWWGLCLVCTSLLLLVSVCLLPAGGRAPQSQDRRRPLGRQCVMFPGEPIPVSVCPHLQLRTLSGNAVPYLLEEVTLADISRMYPPPFPPPPYQSKVTDSRRKM